MRTEFYGCDAGMAPFKCKKKQNQKKFEAFSRFAGVTVDLLFLRFEQLIRFC